VFSRCNTLPTYQTKQHTHLTYQENKSAKLTKETQLNQFILTSKAQKQTLLTQYTHA